MRTLTHTIALLFVTIIVGCTSMGSDAGQQVAAENGDASVVERRSDRPSYTAAPAVTSTTQAAAAMTEVASPPSSQPSAMAQELSTAPAPTPRAMVTPTHTPTTAPTATATPGTARSAAEALTDASGLAEQGIKVYQEQYCGICHPLDAAGTAGLFGPTHNGFAQTIEQRLRDPHYTGTATTAGEYIRESILSPESYLVGGYEQTSHHMPAYITLSETDLDALVQLLLQQK